ncbi:50S ribosome-binding protein YggL [Rheinheimera sp.]|uniref:YggL 50S ribosome-binding family protein n=1 Tax=Rheinheimera sp. TaxID=1869214 RepID=UPI00307DA604
MSKVKSRRLQKKLYLGEFAEYGFMLSCKLALADEHAFSAFLENVIGQVEQRDLVMAGGGDNTQFEAFIWSAHRYGSATVEDIAAVTAWFNSQPQVSELKTSELVDANYGVTSF